MKEEVALDCQMPQATAVFHLQGSRLIGNTPALNAQHSAMS